MNAGYAGMGLTAEDYIEVIDILKELLGDEMYCDETRCLLKDKCESYSEQIPDLKLRLSNRVDYTVKGTDLLQAQAVIDHTGEY